MTEGNRGYEDWQRDVNWDSAVLVEEIGPARTERYRTPVLDISRYAYFHANVGATKANTLVLVEWFADRAANTELGSKEFTTTIEIPVNAIFSTVNQGPFVRVTITPMPAEHEYKPTLRVAGSNRVSSLETPPRGWSLIKRQTTNVAVGGHVTKFPSFYFAGPVEVYLFCGTGNALLSLEVLNSENLLERVAAIEVMAGAIGVQRVSVPLGAWAMSFLNDGEAEEALEYAVTPCVTGAT